MKYLIFLLSIFLIFSVSALNLYAGESHIFDFSDQAEITSIEIAVVNNTYNLDGLDFNISIPYVTLVTSLFYKPDSFSIIFKINGQNYVEDVRGGGGGGGHKKTEPKTYQNYVCGKWSECTSNGQKRLCVSYGNSTEEKTYPTWQSCVPVEIVGSDSENETKIEPETETESKQSYLLEAIFLSAFILVVVYLIVKAILRKGKREESK